MNSAQEKALWDFVRALARERHLSETLGAGRVVRNQGHETNELARALLSVLAEEAPPVLAPCEVCGRPTGGCCTVAGAPEIPPGTIFDPRGGVAAPAPKQERGVEDDIESALEHRDVPITDGRLRMWLRMLREERAASEDRIAHVKAMAETEIRAHKRENASLRERVERLRLRVRTYLDIDPQLKGEARRDLENEMRGEGKGEGTEATK